MKNFVKLIQRAHEDRFAAVIEKTVQLKIPVALLSVASIEQAADAVRNLRAQGLKNITKLIINNPPPVNLEFEVVHLNDAAQIYPQPEYIFTQNEIASRVAIKNFPNSKVIVLNGAADEVYEIFMAHLDDLREVYESLIDEESKKTFCGYWLGRISNQFKSFVYSNASHYLINGFIPAHGAITFDCGAFDGGTATVFSEMGYKVYGFEPDRINYEAARKVAEEKNFVLENLGLGARKHIAHYNAVGHSGSKIIANGTDTIPITTIDAYVRENNLPRVDFIKMDVEGAELDILKGAVTTIARFKPILALSAYHKLDDFWTLMNFVKSIRPDYEFALRQSYDSPEDVPTNFTEELINYFLSLDLEVDARGGGECVLFAR